MQKEHQKTRELTSQKKSKQNYLQKRRNIFKKLLDFSNQYHQDIYICVRDPKKDKVIQYSTDPKKFSLDQVTGLVNVQLQINNTPKSLHSQMEEVEADSTIETSTNNTSSQNPEKSSKPEAPTAPAKVFDARQSVMTYQDHSEPLVPTDKSLFAAPFKSQLSKIASLMDIVPKEQCLESPKELPKVATQFFATDPDHGDYCLRYNSKLSIKDDFAKKYLFRQEEEMSEQSDEYFSDQDSLCYEVNSESSQFIRDETEVKPEDMIFSCCDWEAARECKRKQKTELKEEMPTPVQSQ